MPALSVQGLRKTYGAVEALRGVDLEVAAGTVLAVTGPSASGKTTLLRVLGGDESADAGRISVDGRVLADERIDVDPRDRPMAAVPQGGGLLADRNAGANIALSLPRRVRNSRRGAAQVAAAFDLVGLGAAIADRRPGELSISERQRVALARALIGRPTVLLLDEPFYAFDPATRARFRADLRGLLEHTRTATVLVSHDAADVVELAHQHRALVDGRLEAPDRLSGMPLDHDVLGAETDRLLAFGTRFPHPGGGAYYLDSVGRPDPNRSVHTWITGRMAHVYAIGAGLGRPADGRLADAALAGLTGPGAPLHDAEHGGWFAAVHPDGSVDAGKACYAHAFVVLAGATGTLAGRPGARALLDEALRLWQDRFFDADHGLFVDSWDRAFTVVDPYRGANANMHAVEALLAAGDALGDPALHRQALGVARRLILEFAAPQQWRIPEHFTPDWQPLPDHHRDLPDHPFQPYGATVGHGLEWSRLLLHLEASLSGSAAELTDWLLPAAVSLFDRAAADGWAADGRPGFVYTTDWDGAPVVTDRMHWVAAEAVAAAAALHQRTGDERYADRAGEWWAYIEEYLIDRPRGSWIHQLDEFNVETDTVWPGKPDLYHAVQATLLPRYPLAPCLGAAVYAPQ